MSPVLSSVALQARLALISRATVGIDIQTYLLGDDATGHQLVRALRQAAERGVRVRLLVDDLYTAGLTDLLLGLAAEPHVEVRIYNPFSAGRDSWLLRALSLADANLRAARGQFLPQIRLSASGGAAISSLLGDPITIWSIGGSILAPIFEGGRLRAGAEASGAQRDQAAFAYRRAVLNGFREVEDALASAKRLDEQLSLAIHQRDTLAEALRLATNRFREGYSPFLEQLDAQRGLLAAELSLIQIRTDALNARVQLYQAMGGGWSRSAIEGLE